MRLLLRSRPLVWRNRVIHLFVITPSNTSIYYDPNWKLFCSWYNKPQKKPTTSLDLVSQVPTKPILNILHWQWKLCITTKSIVLREVFSLCYCSILTIFPDDSRNFWTKSVFFCSGSTRKVVYIGYGKNLTIIQNDTILNSKISWTISIRVGFSNSTAIAASLLHLDQNKQNHSVLVHDSSDVRQITMLSCLIRHCDLIPPFSNSFWLELSWVNDLLWFLTQPPNKLFFTVITIPP